MVAICGRACQRHGTVSGRSWMKHLLGIWLHSVRNHRKTALPRRGPLPEPIGAPGIPMMSRGRFPVPSGIVRYPPNRLSRHFPHISTAKPKQDTLRHLYRDRAAMMDPILSACASPAPIIAATNAIISTFVVTPVEHIAVAAQLPEWEGHAATGDGSMGTWMPCDRQGLIYLCGSMNCATITGVKKADARLGRLPCRGWLSLREPPVP
ncbi:Hypothetical protein NGAL_HAMBI2605_63050 [Neorhizobium galegae bv. orientalis]|nr:Hypothetical protein NGAL_HAMBI2605_63050 [Neorhizobium galegae bv. orientalis]